MITLLIVFLVLLISCFGNEVAPEITISQGTLKGTTGKTIKGRTFLSFKGIPYAKPPIGDLRFKEPQPPEPWSGVLNASVNHAMCLQVNIFSLNTVATGDENCLFLNVYTPSISKGQLLPVIVYIHGGGFVIGNANRYGPEKLLDNNLVFVTINYRLGALGFLSTEDDVVPGNNGLKDQNFALKWIRDNIKHFGGNPEKITISGQSAGGASVFFHMLSPLSKDLLHASISISGISIGTWALAQRGEPRRNLHKLAAILDCPIHSSKATVECLKKIDGNTLIEQSVKFWEYNYDPCILFKPVVESPSETAFLTDTPLTLIKNGQFAHIPFMSSVTTEDGAFKVASLHKNLTLIERLNSEFNKLVRLLLNFEELDLDFEAIAETVKSYYFKDRYIDSTSKDLLIDLLTDVMFYVPQRLGSTLYAKYSKQPVYFYVFGYKGSYSYTKLYGDPTTDFGVAHCDDLLYLFESPDLNYKPTEADLKITDLMTTLWYNFANTGNPNPTDSKSKWVPVSTDNLEYYFIKDSNDLTMSKNLYEERYQFWNNLHIFDRNVKDEL
ncbi:hypothetical protein FQA39_LY03769 [Lamprigera yunnana]|nr:hypothetical protein FQA39_LY03769 [Lamprigera yunnana]